MSTLVFNALARWYARVRREEPGQGLIEYSMIILLIAIACIVSLTAFSAVVQERLFSVVETLASDVLGGGG